MINDGIVVFFKSSPENSNVQARAENHSVRRRQEEARVWQVIESRLESGCLPFEIGDTSSDVWELTKKIEGK
jgi:hypothetical protein